LEILTFIFGIIFGLAMFINKGIIFKSLFFAFVGFLGWDFGMRFLDDDDDDDDGNMMEPIFQQI
tara:strand:- start:169 stop:360 length:192 start_codon:yes stop_codon:yes gene_type:complete